MSTQEYLKQAFAGESQANRKYLAFAKKAEAEGFGQVAKLFRAAADAETVHAHNHLRVMEGVKTTQENLQAAIEGETDEFTDMYPAMIKQAENEKNNAAKMSFTNANTVEKEHAKLYSKALELVKNNEDFPKENIHVCQVCGHTHIGEVPDKCPVCGAPKTMFKKIE